MGRDSATVRDGRACAFPLGAAVTVAELGDRPYATLAALRAREPVSWVPALDAWLVTRHDLAVEVLRRPAAFTVDDPRFSTARVVGPSMLSLDGGEHRRHRAPFVDAFRAATVRERLSGWIDAEAERLVAAVASAGAADLRRRLAGPLAVSSMVRVLALDGVDPASALRWYGAMVAAVTDITAGREPAPAAERAMGELRAAVAERPLDPRLTREEQTSNVAVLLFGGVDTTEGAIANALVHVLGAAEPWVRDGAVEESLRLEPAAAVVDRYATASVELGGAAVGRGDLVRVSLTAANRDPAVFADPDRFDPGRPDLGRHLAFARGPHACIGLHLARLEIAAALRTVLDRLPGVRLDPDRPSPIRGLVFRKPAAVHAVWDPR